METEHLKSRNEAIAPNVLRRQLDSGLIHLYPQSILRGMGIKSVYGSRQESIAKNEGFSPWRK